MAPQLSVGVRIFVFVGVLKGPSDHPDTICLRRWCICIHSRFVCVVLCAISLLCACLWVYVTIHLLPNISSL